jgi:hypothetical protein
VKLRSLFVVLSLCLFTMILGVRAGSAQQVQPLEPEWLQQMYAEGWEKVEEGVLRRDTGGGEFETFSYGAEGLQWVIDGYVQQLGFLEERYNETPSEDLAGVIEKLQGQIDKLSEALETAPSAEAVDGGTLAECTEVAYGGQASAGPTLSPRGVTATATAYFHTNCANYIGDTFALAVAEVTDPVTALHTINTNEDPSQGAWIDSSATSSASGSASCHSYAQASVYINGNFVFQTPPAEHYGCPLSPVATISGPATATADYYINNGCVNVTWTASASQGNPGYTYQWYIGTALQGTGSTLTKSYCNASTSATVRVVATDTRGWSDDATFTTNIVYKGPLTASVTGPSSVATNSSTPCANVTWTASASGAHPGYTYSWYIGTGTTVLGTGSTFTQQYCNTSTTVTAKVVASDSDGHTANGTQTTTITHSGDPLTASISGTQLLRLTSPTQCVDLTWTASATGGTSGYTYSWYIGTSTTVQGTGTTLTKRYCGAQAIDVKLVARDSAAQTDDATFRTSLVYFTPIEDDCYYSPSGARICQ